MFAFSRYPLFETINHFPCKRGCEWHAMSVLLSAKDSVNFSFLLFKQPFKIHSNQLSYIWLPCGNTRTHPLVSVVCHWLEEIFIPGCIWNIHQHLKMSKCLQMVRVNVQMTCLFVVTDVVMLVWWPTWWCSHQAYTSSSRRPEVMFAEAFCFLAFQTKIKDHSLARNGKWK